MWSINYILQIHQKKEIISATKNLHIFNPEHDYALAVGDASYTPPASVRNLRKNLSLLPAKYADNGDFILTAEPPDLSDSSTSELQKMAISKNLSIVSYDDIPGLVHKIGNIIPWGWNHYIYKNLLSAGIPSSIMPSLDFIDRVREISHRNNAILFRKEMATLNPSYLKTDNSGEVCYSFKDISNYLEKAGHAYFKAPWSSSGRGIVSSRHIGLKQLEEWCRGIIRKQGCVIAEPEWDKDFDFATEWTLQNRIASFLGFSVFITSPRGKYHGNVLDSQERLADLIYHKTLFTSEIIQHQKSVIEKLWADKYQGPLGIDMLADTSGKVNVCVEINFRLTMGHVNLPNLNSTRYYA